MPSVRRSPLAPLSFAFALSVGACATSTASSSPAEPPQTVQIHTNTGTTAMSVQTEIAPGVASLPAEIRRVWAALPAVYDSLGVTVARLEPASFTIGNESVRLRRRLGNAPLSRFFDCGRSQGGPSADTYELHVSVLTRLARGEADTTTATTTVTATGRPVSFVGDPVSCVSTGRLERRIEELIRQSI